MQRQSLENRNKNILAVQTSFYQKFPSLYSLLSFTSYVTLYMCISELKLYSIKLAGSGESLCSKHWKQSTPVHYGQSTRGQFLKNSYFYGRP